MTYPSNSDSVAQDQLRAFADQIEAFRLDQRRRRRHYASFGATPPHRGTAVRTRHTPGSRLPRRLTGEGVSTDHAEKWLGICETLCRAADDFDHETRRGWVIACRLLGLGWTDVQSALSDTALFGAETAARHWAPYMGSVDARFLGVVYTAEAVGRPGTIKVGFSTDPNRRMVELRRTQHAHVRLLSTRPATMLHEWALHQSINRQVEPEWYPVNELPSFLHSSGMEA